MANAAAATLAAAGYSDIAVEVGDGTMGWPDRAPYDAIVVTAAGPRPPPELLGQLADGGRLVMPVGPRDGVQELVRVVRHGDHHDREALGAVRFVPLIGAEGFPA